MIAFPILPICNDKYGKQKKKIIRTSERRLKKRWKRCVLELINAISVKMASISLGSTCGTESFAVIVFTLEDEDDADVLDVFF